VLPSLGAALQDPYIVYGYVRYPDGYPAAQLPVDVHTPSQIKNTLSDSDGRYSVIFDNYNYSDPITVIVTGVEACGSIDSFRPASMISITVPYTSKETQPSGFGGGGGSDTFKVICSQINSTAIVVLAILAILSTTAVVYSFAQGTLSFYIIIGKAQAFKRSLRRLMEK